MVASFPPFCNGFSVENKNVEEGIEEKDVGRLNGSRIQKNRLAALMLQGVRIQCGLDHDKGIPRVFVVENMPVEGRLVRRVVEHLQELASPEMEHKLGV